jgi:hypothetical protein
MLAGGKYDPLSWDGFFDSLEFIIDGQYPLYLAGVKD